MSNRRQRVCISNAPCDFRSVDQGVPQGSVLGQLPFNLCLSNLPELVTDCVAATLLLFADDKTLHAADTCASAAAASVSGALAAICNDLKHKGLAVHVHKTVSMIISLPSAKATCRVICNGATLPLVREHHVLGVIIDDKLSW